MGLCFGVVFGLGLGVQGFGALNPKIQPLNPRVLGFRFRFMAFRAEVPCLSYTERQAGIRIKRFLSLNIYIYELNRGYRCPSNNGESSGKKLENDMETGIIG